ncbi:unnamed protein product [Caenorhabditis sp. 36 PRJEB53466]|nr:unnamed protein product [Caenorhabditis sp. 36 PRJEB53466]
MPHYDECSLNSISYSLIQTEQIPGDFSDDSCTCGHDDHAFGDTFHPIKKDRQDSYSRLESTKNYGTATEHELLKPYPKHVADRFEAEYDYCFRWASDHKFIAAKVIPFQSNFYSVVRLMFKGRNWVLDCANYDGQYDYCGWLPSSPPLSNHKLLIPKGQSLLSDSSEFTNYREEAGKVMTLHPSDTIYGMRSLSTDYTDDSVLSKDPIDYDIYKAVGVSSESEMQNSLHSTLDNLSPIPGNYQMAMRSVSDISTGSSLKAVFHDLVELDELFAQQVEQASRSSLEEYVNCLTTAHSFSESVIASSLAESKSESQVIGSVEVVKPSKGLAQLACLAGRKLNIVFWKNWSKK